VPRDTEQVGMSLIGWPHVAGNCFLWPRYVRICEQNIGRARNCGRIEPDLQDAFSAMPSMTPVSADISENQGY